MIYSVHGCREPVDALGILRNWELTFPDHKMGKHQRGVRRIGDTYFSIWRTKTGWHISEYVSRLAKPQ